MSDLDDVLDQMAFAGLRPKELVAKIAADLTASRRFTSRADIENHIAGLVARYGGRLGGMTRKNLVSLVERKLNLRAIRQWEKTQAWLNSLQSDDAPSA